MNRIITGQASGKRMSVGELRRFLESIEEVADDTPVKAKVAVGGHLRQVTVEEKLKHTAPAEDVMFGRDTSE